MDSTSIHNRSLLSIWHFLSDEERREFENAVEMFDNPAPGNPVDAEEFLEMRVEALVRRLVILRHQAEAVGLLRVP